MIQRGCSETGAIGEVLLSRNSFFKMAREKIFQFNQHDDSRTNFPASWTHTPLFSFFNTPQIIGPRGPVGESWKPICRRVNPNARRMVSS